MRATIRNVQSDGVFLAATLRKFGGNAGPLWQERHERPGSHQLKPTRIETLRAVLVELQRHEQRVIEEIRELEG